MSITAQALKERWDKAIKAVRPEINDYRMNCAFVENEQWINTNPVTHQIERFPRRNPDRVRMTVNRLLPASRSVMSQLFTRPNFFNVAPTAADDATVGAANLAMQVLEYYRETQDWELIREDHGWITWKGGTGALCLEWDPDAGRLVQEVDGKTVHEGDITGSALAMGEFVVASGSRDAERAHWWIKATAMPVEQAQAELGLDDEPKPDTVAATAPYDTASAEERRNLVTVYTYYERPHGDVKGEMSIVVGTDVAKSGAWPFPFKDRLNLFVARETPRHGKWAGITVLTSARGPQVAYNQSHSSIVEHMKNCGNARTWVPWTTWDHIEELTDTPGEFYPYDDTVGKPFVVSPPQMPNWWVSQPDRLAAVIDYQLANPDVSHGVAPRNVESGLGLSILSENAQSPLGHLVKELARCWARYGTCALRTLEAKVTEPRSGAYVNNPDDLPEEFTWTGAELRGQTTVDVPLDAVAPRSRAQTEAWAQALLDRQAITLRQFARLVDVPEQRETLNIIDPDAAKQQRENRRMARGEEIDPADFDDHKKHMAELNAFRKSETFERLAPDVQLLFERHGLMHEQAALRDAQKDALRQMADQNAAFAANVQETPGSMPVMPSGGPDAATFGGDNPYRAPGSEPVAPPGGGGPDQGGQGGRPLPPGGVPIGALR